MATAAVVESKGLRPTIAFAVIAGALTLLVVWVGYVTVPVSDQQLLVAAGDGGVSLVDTATGEVAYTVPDAVPTPDRRALLTTREGGDVTLLETRNPLTGAVTGTTRVPQGLAVRTISPRGGAVALMPGSYQGGLYAPEGRVRTTITVAFVDDRPGMSFDLEGNIEPEMFSLDEDSLFVLDFEPPETPDSYTVRRLDLETGVLTDTASPHVDVDPRMRGRARAQVLRPDGTYLYTLYTLDGDQGFIHVINLEEEWTHCIFLPSGVASDEQAAVGMALSPDGRRLVVADAGSSTLTDVDTQTYETAEPLDAPDLTVTGDVAIDEDGNTYVVAGPEVAVYPPGAALPNRDGFLQADGGHVTGLAVAGNEVRIAFGGTITILDRVTGEELAVVRGPGEQDLDLIGPPQGSVLSFPLVCAC